ncbi:MAG: LacI family DNA-binding transcriptional regulator [Lentisphaeria bacterium]|nr:LacI family DNA-binding transcriptional regulator [Lentisphaeria bacterium]
MSRTTLKDIARACGVTPTLVWAVVNGRLGKITCVPEKKRLILETARKMGYRPNVFARSMVKRNVPVAALMFNMTEANRVRGSGYFARRAAALTFGLEKYQIESLLVFYRSEEEQIEKFDALRSKGLIGGVISNLIPGANLNFVSCLVDSGVPYVIMGRPRIPAVSVSPDGRCAFIGECLKHVGARRAYLYQEMENRPVLFPWYDRPDYYRFDYAPLPAEESVTADPENLIVFLGADYLLRSPLRFAHPFIAEEEQLEYLIPAGIPYALFRSSASNSERAVQILAEWMLGGKAPQGDCRQTLPGGDLIKIVWNGPGK